MDSHELARFILENEQNPLVRVYTKVNDRDTVEVTLIKLWLSTWFFGRDEMSEELALKTLDYIIREKKSNGQ